MGWGFEEVIEPSIFVNKTPPNGAAFIISAEHELGVTGRLHVVMLGNDDRKFGYCPQECRGFHEFGGYCLSMSRITREQWNIWKEYFEILVWRTNTFGGPASGQGDPAFYNAMDNDEAEAAA